MTRKDYIKIADIVRHGKQQFASHGHWHAVRFFEVALTEMLAQDNPRFDRARFAQACQPKEED